VHFLTQSEETPAQATNRSGHRFWCILKQTLVTLHVTVRHVLGAYDLFQDMC
jgi:hypothetical protein